MTENESHMQFIKQAFGGAWITQGIAVAAELGIADLLTDGPLTVEDLASQTGANATALYRVLRALASVGIFAEEEEHRFSLTPRVEILNSNAPGSQRALAMMMGGEFQGAWGELLHTVRTGEQGFRKRFGLPFFEYMKRSPDRHAIYDAAMNGIHGPETVQVLDAYDFSGFRTVVDVGGGNGQMLSTILGRHPGLHGTLFDLPAVADRARVFLAETGMSERCWVMGGDFFSSVPAGADAYLLRHIIHDWEDDNAATILRNCRKAIDAKGRVLVIESILPPGNEPSFGKWLDLMMLLVGGRERTLADYTRLFADAGLTLNQVVQTAGEVAVLEGVPAA